jgi:hypothetical protein
MTSKEWDKLPKAKQRRKNVAVLPLDATGLHDGIVTLRIANAGYGKRASQVAVRLKICLKQQGFTKLKSSGTRIEIDIHGPGAFAPPKVAKQKPAKRATR